MARLTVVSDAWFTVETCPLTGEVTAIHARMPPAQVWCVPVTGPCGLWWSMITRSCIWASNV